MDWRLIVVAVLSYLIGSLPFTYFIVKFYSGIDLSKAGTRNIGAMNSYEVTKSKLIGTRAFLGDFSKGFIALTLAGLLFGYSTMILGVALIFAVLGHNFSFLLSFKGGRGLATSMGGFFLINPIIIFVWMILYIVHFYIIKKDIHKSNIFASAGAPFIIWFTSPAIIHSFELFGVTNVFDYRIVSTIVCMIIVVAHNKNYFSTIINNYSKD